MQIHEREAPVNQAAVVIGQAIIAAIEKFSLTHGELTRILARELAETAKYQIRQERHGDENKPGGEA